MAKINTNDLIASELEKGEKISIIINRLNKLRDLKKTTKEQHDDIIHLVAEFLVESSELCELKARNKKLFQESEKT